MTIPEKQIYPRTGDKETIFRRNHFFLIKMVELAQRKNPGKYPGYTIRQYQRIKSGYGRWIGW